MIAAATAGNRLALQPDGQVPSRLQGGLKAACAAKLQRAPSGQSAVGLDCHHIDGGVAGLCGRETCDFLNSLQSYGWR